MSMNKGKRRDPVRMFETEQHREGHVSLSGHTVYTTFFKNIALHSDLYSIFACKKSKSFFRVISLLVLLNMKVR